MAVNECDIALPRELGDDFAATFGRLQRLFRARGLAAEDAADLAQATVERLLVHVRKRGLDERFALYGLTPLINRIATNLFIDHYRANGKRTVPLDEAEEIEFSGATPEEAFVRRARMRALKDAIEALPDRYRRAIAMSLAGLSPAEIAADFGIRRNAADVLLYRARRQLADRLRVVGDEIRLGVAFLFGWLRATARRVTDSRTGDASAVAGAMGIQLASAVLGLALSLPSAGAAATVPVAGATATSRHAIASTGARAPLPSDLLHDAGRGAEPFRTTVRLDEGRIRVGTEIDDVAEPGRRAPLGLDVWYEREEERGATGPVIDHAITRSCDAAPSACAPTTRG